MGPSFRETLGGLVTGDAGDDAVEGRPQGSLLDLSFELAGGLLVFDDRFLGEQQVGLRHFEFGPGAGEFVGVGIVAGGEFFEFGQALPAHIEFRGGGADAGRALGPHPGDGQLALQDATVELGEQVAGLDPLAFLHRNHANNAGLGKGEIDLLLWFGHSHDRGIAGLAGREGKRRAKDENGEDDEKKDRFHFWRRRRGSKAAFGVGEPVVVPKQTAAGFVAVFFRFGLCPEEAFEPAAGGGDFARVIVLRSGELFGVGGRIVPKHEIVRGQEKLRGAGLTLAGATAGQLEIDAPRFFHFQANDMQSPQLGDTRTQIDVGAASRHVGGDGDSAPLSRLGDDGGFLRVLPGVEDAMGNAGGLEQGREFLAVSDGARSDENGLAPVTQFRDLPDHRPELGLFRGKNPGRQLPGLAGPVAGDGCHRDPEDFPEFPGGVQGGSSHAGHGFVEPVIPLAGNRRGRLRLGVDRLVFLGFDGLVQPVFPGTLGPGPSGELVDDDDLFLLDDVVNVAFQPETGSQGVFHIAMPGAAKRLPGHGELAGMDPAETGFGQLDRPASGGRREIPPLLQDPGDVPGHEERFGMRMRSVLPGADDEGSGRFVDEDTVGFVDNGERQVPLAQADAFGGRQVQRQLREPLAERWFRLFETLELISQVIEPEFRSRPKSDVGGVGRGLGRTGNALRKQRGSHPEKPEQLRRKRLVSLGQVAVGGGDMHPASEKRPGVGDQRLDQGLAFASGHLGDRSPAHGETGQDLDVVMEQTDGSPASLANGGESGSDPVRKRLAGLDLFAEPPAAGVELGGVEPGKFGREFVDPGELGLVIPAPDFRGCSRSRGAGKGKQSPDRFVSHPVQVPFDGVLPAEGGPPVTKTGGALARWGR